MEFKLTTDLTVLPAISFNAAELREELAPKLAYYEQLAVTPDSIKAAKEDRAKLNKLREELDLRRKKVKREYLAPLESFEAEVKTVTDMIDAPIAAIDRQIKAYEAQERADKLRAIEAHFDENADVLALDIDLSKILPPKWANKSEKLANICEHIDNEARRITKEHAELCRMYEGSPHRTAVLQCYLQGGYDKAAALAYAAALVQAEARQAAAPEEDEPVLTGTFRVTGKRSDIIALRDFLRARNMQFEVIA